jgi:hypothetical protein
VARAQLRQPPGDSVRPVIERRLHVSPLPEGAADRLGSHPVVDAGQQLLTVSIMTES